MADGGGGRGEEGIFAFYDRRMGLEFKSLLIAKQLSPDLLVPFFIADVFFGE